MFDLRHASIGLRKAAYRRGFRVGCNGTYYIPIYHSEIGDVAIVGNHSGKEVTISEDEVQCFNEMSWKEVKRG